MFVFTLFCCFISLLFANDVEFYKQEVQCWPRSIKCCGNNEHSLLYQSLYDRARLFLSFRQEPRIPKVIHQIWLDGPLPPKVQSLINSWKENHPNWKYYLWTSKEIKNIYLFNRNLYEASSDFQMKLAILKLELLYQFGGVCVDINLESIYPNDVFHHISDFYIGLKTDDIDIDGWTSSIVMGAKKRAEFIKAILCHIRKSFSSNEKKPQHSTNEHFSYNKLKKVTRLLLLNRRYIKLNPFRLVLPKVFFYSLDSKNSSNKLYPLSSEQVLQSLSPSVYAIQHYDIS